MSEFLIFGGTSEGRLLAEFCAENGIFADVSVATAYGAELLPKSRYITIFTGKKSESEMTEILKNHQYKAVIDATHPFAQDVTKNIKSACKNVKYIRLKRESELKLSGLIFDNLSEIIDFCNKFNGNILSTLGSNKCHEITKINNFKERVWLRILPLKENIKKCLDEGFTEKHIIAENSPFSLERNIQHIRLCNADFLLTKETGSTGGYAEKVKAAEICGIQLVTLRRPNEEGISFNEVKKLLLMKG